MKKLIPLSSIIDCGVWHKAPNTRSSLQEAINALGNDCYIINGGAFSYETSTQPAKPNDAYTIDNVIYHNGGTGLGYSFKIPNLISFSYLNSIKYPDFISCFESYLQNGTINKTPPGTSLTQHTILGLTSTHLYIDCDENPTYANQVLVEARNIGCTSAINLDGGGSTQYRDPVANKQFATTRKVLNWVWFKINNTNGGNTVPKIMIDPGHGGNYDTIYRVLQNNAMVNLHGDAGTSAAGIREADIVLPIALELGQRLSGHGFDVEFTRTTDELVTLDERCKYENEGNFNAFVSLHANAANGSASGVETYCYALGGQGEQLATKVQAAIVAATQCINRGVKTNNYQVLRETTSPAILIETGFLDNTSDRTKLTDPAYQSLMSRAITQGICQQFGITYSTGNRNLSLNLADPTPNYPEIINDDPPINPPTPTENLITIQQLQQMGYTGVKF